MSARIDHAAEARANIDYADEAFSAGENESAHAMAAIAQGHATLALFEQQRIANLQHESYRLREKAGARTDRAAGSLLEQADRIDAEIREALGLA